MIRRPATRVETGPSGRRCLRLAYPLPAADYPGHFPDVSGSEWILPVVDPDNFQAVRSDLGSAVARRAIGAWVTGALSRGLTLREAAANDPRHRAMRGRGTVYLVEADGVECVVRRYLRGGGMRFLGDRYLRLGNPRPVLETDASEEARARGIPTPRVLAWAVYPAGAFYRADLVTEFIPASSTLAALLFEDAAPIEHRPEILTAAGELVARLADAGLYHSDLNARNILLQRLEGRYQPFALDLDRMLVNRTGRGGDPAVMFARLERSIRKLAPGGAEPLSGIEWQLLRKGSGVMAGERQ